MVSLKKLLCCIIAFSLVLTLAASGATAFIGNEFISSILSNTSDDLIEDNEDTGEASDDNATDNGSSEETTPDEEDSTDPEVPDENQDSSNESEGEDTEPETPNEGGDSNEDTESEDPSEGEDTGNDSGEETPPEEGEGTESETPDEGGDSNEDAEGEDPSEGEDTGNDSGEETPPEEGEGTESETPDEGGDSNEDAEGEDPSEGEDTGNDSGEETPPEEGEGTESETPDEGGDSNEDAEGEDPSEGEDTGNDSGEETPPEEGEDGEDTTDPSLPPEEEPPVEEELSIGEQLIRIGIYYGTAGKDSVELSLTSGSGYYLGYYDTANDNQFVILDVITTKNITVSTSSSTMVVSSTSSGSELYRHDPSFGTQLGILPYSDSGEKTLTKCGYNYYGGFRFERISAYDNTMTIVNMVPLDDYIKGVVPYEMSPSWPEEALKVQTICARTFALSHKGKHKKTFSFDLCDSDCCQVYKGYYAKGNASVLEYVVDSTAGMVLMYNGEYCETVYSSSNGGASESAKNVWGKDIPYLQGIFDPYEEFIADRISKYNWEFTFTTEELQEKLIASGYTNCGLIKEVNTTFSDTGNVIVLTFIDENDKSYSIYNGKCRTFLTLRSLRYTVSSTPGAQEDTEENSIPVNEDESLVLNQGVAVISGDGTISYITTGYILTAEGIEEIASEPTPSVEGTTFTFSGTGWGHNVGMSQYGSYAMAELGYTFDQILEFYYTGAVVVQL